MLATDPQDLAALAEHAARSVSVVAVYDGTAVVEAGHSRAAEHPPNTLGRAKSTDRNVEVLQPLD